jgi:hypothetical protein
LVEALQETPAIQVTPETLVKVDQVEVVAMRILQVGAAAISNI